MSEEKFTTEIVHKVYDDSTGEHIAVCPDADTGDLLDIRQVDAKGKILVRITGYPEQMRLVAMAILKLTEPE